ncbi:GrpE-domain-containing protein [Geopyxis carbonaria]|nr:GrpE-domain-containing protein [Geopyxis carbonaria]
MFKRSLLNHTRHFSTRRLAAAATRPCAPPLVTPTVRQWQLVPAYSRAVRRAYSAEAKEEKPAEPAEAETEPAAVDGAKLAKELEKIQGELEAKTQEAKDLKDKFARAVAEFRNLQDRTERDKRTARDFAIQKFAKDLVDSVDNLDRALSAVPEESRTNAEKNKELVDFYNGLKMTEEILLNTLKKHGLEKINPVGEEFDPNKHEATFQVPMPDKTPNTVFHVQQTGFMLNGRTIRAAKVGVVASP